MTFDSVLFVFGAGILTGGATVYVLYTRIAVVAAELKAKVDAFERAFGVLKADVSGLAPAAAVQAAAAPSGPVPAFAPPGTTSTPTTSAPEPAAHPPAA